MKERETNPDTLTVENSCHSQAAEILLHSWTDVRGLIHFLLYMNSYLCALNTGCWQITTVVFHLSAFALHLSLRYLSGKL